MSSQEEMNEDCPPDLPPPVKSENEDCDQKIQIEPPRAPLWVHLLPVIFILPVWGRLIGGAKEMSNAGRQYSGLDPQKSHKKLRKFTSK